MIFGTRKQEAIRFFFSLTIGATVDSIFCLNVDRQETTQHNSKIRRFNLIIQLTGTLPQPVE